MAASTRATSNPGQARWGSAWLASTLSHPLAVWALDPSLLAHGATKGIGNILPAVQSPRCEFSEGLSFTSLRLEKSQGRTFDWLFNSQTHPCTNRSGWKNGKL